MGSIHAIGRWLVLLGVAASLMSGCGLPGATAEDQPTTSPVSTHGATCNVLPWRVHDLAWMDDESVVVGGVDSELAGVVGMVDAATGHATEVARDFEIGPLFPVAGRDGRAYWSPLGAADVWMSSNDEPARATLTTPFALIGDFVLVDRGVLVGGFGPDQTTAVAAWFDHDGGSQEVVLDQSNIGYIEVAASADGATSLILTTGLPEAPGGAAQKLALTTPDGSRSLLIEDLIEHVSLSADGSRMTYRSRTTGHVVELNLATGKSVVLVEDAEAGYRSANGALAYTRFSLDGQSSLLCLVP